MSLKRKIAIIVWISEIIVLFLCEIKTQTSEAYNSISDITMFDEKNADSISKNNTLNVVVPESAETTGAMETEKLAVAETNENDGYRYVLHFFFFK